MSKKPHKEFSMFIFFLLQFVVAISIKGSFHQDLEVEAGTMIVLDGILKTFVTQNGDFQLDDIADGIHVLSITSQEYHFDSV
jgi:hypothetical protein